MDTVSIRKKIMEVRSLHNIVFDPKEEQIEITASILKNRNVLGLLPTGFGKTLCMVLPTMLEEKESITLVVSPLISLIDEQLSIFSKWNFRCAKIEGLSEMTHETIQGMHKGTFQFVFSSPESVLKQHWRRIFFSQVWQARLRLLVIDEAHCISEWGEDFRPEYMQLCELRSCFNVPIMALTATTTVKVKGDIMRSLHLEETDTDVIFRSPDRPNIYLQVLKRNCTDYSLSLQWFIDHIRKNGVLSKKTIIYCRSIDSVSEIFLTLKSCLGEKAYADGIKDSNHLLVEMFHKRTHSDSKKRILSNFMEDNSSVRCIIATVALGMGLDIRNIDLIVHIGCPKSVLSYWQEAGRCARDGRQGFSLIFFDNFTLSLKTTDKDMAAIVRNETNQCIRKQILCVLSIEDDFEPKIESSICNGCDLNQCLCAACKCCSFCRLKCPCHERSGFDVTRFLEETDCE